MNGFKDFKLGDGPSIQAPNGGSPPRGLPLCGLPPRGLPLCGSPPRGLPAESLLSDNALDEVGALDEVEEGGFSSLCIYETVQELIYQLKPFESMNYLFVIDGQVARLSSLQVWVDSLPLALKLPHPAESAKSFSFLEELLDQLVEHDCQGVVAIGGGGCLDVAGLAAHLYKRGVEWIAVPTTLLAMVDASIGGKCAVNWHSYKNMVGALHSPSKLFSSYALLGEDVQSDVIQGGVVEAYKHALLASSSLGTLLREWMIKPDLSRLRELIPLAASIKERVVFLESQDSWRGVRHLLNLGHTVAHGLEWLYAEQGLPGMTHARAVAIGLVVESHLFCRGLKRSGLDDNGSRANAASCVISSEASTTDWNRSIDEPIYRDMLPLIGSWPNLSSEQWQLLLRAMQRDKKAKSREISKIPLSKFGELYKMVIQQTSYIVECTHQEMTDAWQSCQRRMAADLY